MENSRNESWIAQEYEKQKNEKQNKESNDTRLLFHIPKAGKTVVRIISPPDGVWFKEINEYYFQNVGYTVSPRDFGMEDPVWDFSESVYQKGNEDAIKEASRFRPKIKYIMNAIILSAPDGSSPADGIKVLKVPTEVKRYLVKYDYEREWGDITNNENGLNIIIEREGTGQYDTSYMVMPQTSRTNIFQILSEAGVDPSSLTIHDLDEAHRSELRTSEEMLGILEQLKGEVESKSKPKVPKMSFGGATGFGPEKTSPQPVASGSFPSPVMQAPEGQSLPKGIVIPNPPMKGGN